MKIIITERQNTLLMENFPPGLRRRINYDEIKGHLEFTIENFDFDPCDFGSLGDFIGEICDMISNDIIDDFNYETKETITPKEKDDLYYFMVDNFADYLQEIYDEQCN